MEFLQGFSFFSVYTLKNILKVEGAATLLFNFQYQFKYFFKKWPLFFTHTHTQSNVLIFANENIWEELQVFVP